MKKVITLLFLALLASQSVFAQGAWTVELVPNTRLKSNLIHVSDPDNYLSPEAEMRINTALSSIRDSADVFLVALNSIGSADPQSFRFELFRHWGIGDKTKNNGLLLLFVEDQHAFEFETGYGIEPVLPDIICQQIFQKTIKPYFKQGDYEGGMIAGVFDIVDVFGGTVPDELITVLPDNEDYEKAKEERDKEVVSDFAMWIIMILCVCIPGLAFIRYLTHWSDNKKEKNTDVKDSYTIKENDGVNCIYDITNNWTGSAWQGKGCSKAIYFGLSGLILYFVVSTLCYAFMADEEDLFINDLTAVVSLLGYLTWICWRHNSRELKMADKLAKESITPKKIYSIAKNYRRTKYVNYAAIWLGYHYMKEYDKRIAEAPEMLCPICKAVMTENDELKLSEKQAFEQENNIRKYVSLRCDEGHVFMKVANGKSYKSYKDCPKCGMHAYQITDRKVLEKATYTHKGEEEVTYTCKFCGAMAVATVVIPMLVRTTSSGGYSSGGYSSRGSSSSSGGSFGGGSSGGGGYSGRW